MLFGFTCLDFKWNNQNTTRFYCFISVPDRKIEKSPECTQTILRSRVLILITRGNLREMKRDGDCFKDWRALLHEFRSPAPMMHNRKHFSSHLCFCFIIMNPSWYADTQLKHDITLTSCVSSSKAERLFFFRASTFHTFQYL